MGGTEGSKLSGGGFGGSAPTSFVFSSASTGKYAVYPRNATLEAVQTEWDNQRGGMADPQGPGSADRPDQVLSVIARGGEGSVTAA